MCLGVPGKIISIEDDSPLTRQGKVRFAGVTKLINLALVPEASKDDYVIVHAGFAISRVDQAEARRIFEFLSSIDELEP